MTIHFKALAVLTATLLATGAHAATNLIGNGSFETVDYASFDSDYQKNTNAYLESTVNIGTNPNGVHGSWASFAAVDGQNMLIVNGSNSASNVVWSQTLNLQAGSYDFSALAASTYPENPSNLKVVYTIGATTTDIGALQLGATTGQWNSLAGSFTLGGAASVQIKLLDLSTQYGGNDFAVDKLSLTAAAVPEPETYALMLAGLGVVGFVARRRRAV
ncbi:hypothetical protein BH11PSE10_BH11PSE10_20780 [soil metagenome]